jgi:hypothetical protein
MSKHLLCCGLLALTVLLFGCESSRPPTPVDGKVDILQPAASISLPDLLSKTRADLAERAQDLTAKIGVQERSRREGKIPWLLLPKLRLPLAVPVWREAAYSSAATMSLPPYLPPASKDAEVALHLAANGDTEAARQLVAEQDAVTLKRIEEGRYGCNYPVEWTRLVALLLHSAQLRLATGDLDGAREVITLHRQLREILDPKAASSALGSALLSRGRDTLTQAAAVWSAEHKQELAEQARRALAEWGDTQASPPGLRPGMPRAEVCRLLGCPAKGKVVSVSSVTRAFDVLGMAVPDDRAEAVFVCFDSADRLADLVIAYRAGLAEYFPQPSDLARLLEEQGITGAESPPSPGLQRKVYTIGEEACEILVVGRGAGIGGLLRWTSAHPTPATHQLARDFGALHLDRSFEQNRLRLMPEQFGETLTVKRPELLAQVANPVPFLKLSQASIQRAQDHDLPTSLTLSYGIDVSGVPPLHEFLLSLWNAAGAPEIRGADDATGGHLEFVWADRQTGYRLILPYESGQVIRLEAVDLTPSDMLTERKTRAAALDRVERAARIQAGKPQHRLPRQWEQIELGMTRSQVTQDLPVGSAVVKTPFAGGISVTLVGDPTDKSSTVLRQLLIRFDGSDQVAELRARYAVSPSAERSTEILSVIRKAGGAPRDVPVPASSLWGDLPAQRPQPVGYEWRDDRTRLVYRQDRSGIDIILRDCPPQHPDGVPLPALSFLARGVDNCELGMSREELLHKWSIAKPTFTEDKALILRPAAASPYDALLVWFEKDRIVRIIAQHQQTRTATGRPAKADQALTDTWGKELRALGWPKREDFAAGDVLQSLGWYDDLTRTRLFWQEYDSGALRLFTEWKDIARP